MNRFAFYFLLYFGNFALVNLFSPGHLNDFLKTYLFLICLYPVGHLAHKILGGERLILNVWFGDALKIILAIPVVGLLAVLTGLDVFVLSLLILVCTGYLMLPLDSHGTMRMSVSRFRKSINPFQGSEGIVRLSLLVFSVMLTLSLGPAFSFPSIANGNVLLTPEVGDTSQYWGNINSITRHSGNLFDGFQVSYIAKADFKRLMPNIGSFYPLTLIVETFEAQAVKALYVDTVVFHSLIWTEFSMLLLIWLCLCPATEGGANSKPWHYLLRVGLPFLAFTVPLLVGWRTVSYLIVVFFGNWRISFGTLFLVSAFRIFLLDLDLRVGRRNATRIGFITMLFTFAAWVHPITGIPFLGGWLAFLTAELARERQFVFTAKSVAATTVIGIVVVSALGVLSIKMPLSSYNAAANLSFLLRIWPTFGIGRAAIILVATLVALIGYHYRRRVMANLTNSRTRAWKIGIAIFLVILSIWFAITFLMSTGKLESVDPHWSEAIKASLSNGTAGWGRGAGGVLMVEWINFIKALGVVLLCSVFWTPLVFYVLMSGQRPVRWFLLSMMGVLLIVAWLPPSPGNLSLGAMGGMYLPYHFFLLGIFMLMASLGSNEASRLSSKLALTSVIAISALSAFSSHWSVVLRRENIHLPSDLFAVVEYVKAHTPSETVVISNTSLQDFYALFGGYAGRVAVNERAVYYAPVYAERKFDVASFYKAPFLDLTARSVMEKYSVTHVLLGPKDTLHLPAGQYSLEYGKGGYRLFRYMR